MYNRYIILLLLLLLLSFTFLVSYIESVLRLKVYSEYIFVKIYFYERFILYVGNK